MFLGETVVVIGTVLTSLATLFVCLRCLSRFTILRTSSADDYLIIICMILSWVLMACIIAQLPYGLGKHFKDVQLQKLAVTAKLTYVCQIDYNIALTSLKLSALLQILRFTIARRSRTAAWVLVGMTSAYGTAIVTTCVLVCWPISFYWDKMIQGKCIDTLLWGIISVSLNVVTDLAVIALPLYVLRDLRLSRRDKLVVQSTFAVGGLTCLTSVFRLYFIWISSTNMDFTYNAAHVGLWSVIELNVGISCTCVPTIRPLLQRYSSTHFATSALSSDQTEDSEATLIGSIKSKLAHSKYSCGSHSDNDQTEHSNAISLGSIRSKFSHRNQSNEDESTLVRPLETI